MSSPAPHPLATHHSNATEPHLPATRNRKRISANPPSSASQPQSPSLPSNPNDCTASPLAAATRDSFAYTTFHFHPTSTQIPHQHHHHSQGDRDDDEEKKQDPGHPIYAGFSREPGAASSMPLYLGSHHPNTTEAPYHYSNDTASSKTSSVMPSQGFAHLTQPHPKPFARAQTSAATGQNIPIPSNLRVRSIGPYQLLQTVGIGEFGKVKLALRSDSNEKVAIKLFRKAHIAKDQSRIQKLRREIRMLKMVSHPNVVCLYQVIETRDTVGLVFDYASGGELFDYILTNHYLGEDLAKRLFSQLIDGVKYVHDRGIVHRDLKLENLLLTERLNLVIIDFGFSSRVKGKRGTLRRECGNPAAEMEGQDEDEEEEQVLYTSCGSPCYAAPELALGQGYRGTSADLWSCGVILYAMLAGYLPFDDDPLNPDSENVTLLYKYILSVPTPIHFPPYFSDNVRNLLEKMVVPDPRKRIDMDGILAHDWMKRFDELRLKRSEEEETRSRPSARPSSKQRHKRLYNGTEAPRGSKGRLKTVRESEESSICAVEEGSHARSRGDTSARPVIASYMRPSDYMSDISEKALYKAHDRGSDNDTVVGEAVTKPEWGKRMPNIQESVTEGDDGVLTETPVSVKPFSRIFKSSHHSADHMTGSDLSGQPFGNPLPRPAASFRSDDRRRSVPVHSAASSSLQSLKSDLELSPSLWRRFRKRQKSHDSVSDRGRQKLKHKTMRPQKSRAIASLSMKTIVSSCGTVIRKVFGTVLAHEEGVKRPIEVIVGNGDESKGEEPARRTRRLLRTKYDTYALKEDVDAVTSEGRQRARMQRDRRRVPPPGDCDTLASTYYGNWFSVHDLPSLVQTRQGEQEDQQEHYQQNREQGDTKRRHFKHHPARRALGIHVEAWNTTGAINMRRAVERRVPPPSLTFHDGTIEPDLLTSLTPDVLFLTLQDMLITLGVTISPANAKFDHPFKIYGQWRIDTASGSHWKASLQLPNASKNSVIGSRNAGSKVSLYRDPACREKQQVFSVTVEGPPSKAQTKYHEQLQRPSASDPFVSREPVDGPYDPTRVAQLNDDRLLSMEAYWQNKADYLARHAPGLSDIDGRESATAPVQRGPSFRKITTTSPEDDSAHRKGTRVPDDGHQAANPGTSRGFVPWSDVRRAGLEPSVTADHGGSTRSAGLEDSHPGLRVPVPRRRKHSGAARDGRSRGTISAGRRYSLSTSDSTPDQAPFLSDHPPPLYTSTGTNHVARNLTSVFRTNRDLSFSVEICKVAHLRHLYYVKLVRLGSRGSNFAYRLLRQVMIQRLRNSERTMVEMEPVLHRTRKKHAAGIQRGRSG